MGRRIITNQYQSKGEEAKLDGYFDKLIKYIPTEIVGGWVAITGLIKGASNIPTNTIMDFLHYLYWTNCSLYSQANL